MRQSLCSPVGGQPIRKYELKSKVQRVLSKTEYINNKYEKRAVMCGLQEGILYVPLFEDGTYHLLLTRDSAWTEDVNKGNEISVVQLGNYEPKEIKLLITDETTDVSSRTQEEIWSPEDNSTMYAKLNEVDKLRFYWNSPLEYAAMRAFEFTIGDSLATETKRMRTLIHNCFDTSQYESLFIGESPPRSLSGMRTASRYINPCSRAGQYCLRVPGPQMMTRYVHNLQLV